MVEIKKKTLKELDEQYEKEYKKGETQRKKDRLINKIKDMTKGELAMIPESVFDELCSKYIPEIDKVNYNTTDNLTLIKQIGFINMGTLETLPQEEKFDGLSCFLNSRYSDDELEEMFYMEIGDNVPEMDEFGHWRWKHEEQAKIEEDDE